MRKVTMIEFNPQNLKETQKAINITLEDSNVLLKPISSFIDSDCLFALTKNNLYLYRTIDYGYVFVLNDQERIIG